MFLAVKDGEAPYSKQKQDLELTVAQIISSILQNSVWIEESNLSGKPLGHSGMTLNHIPYNYTVEVTNRFKGLNLVHRVLDLFFKQTKFVLQAWRTMEGGSQYYIGGSDQNHPKEKERQKGKVVVWGGFRNSWGKKEVKSKEESGRYTQLNAKFQRQKGDIKRSFKVNNAKK